MKRFFTVVAIVAAIVVSTAAFAYVTEGASDAAVGTVQFECTEMPALNFTMPVSKAAEIICLMPESVAGVCYQEYQAVREKCSRSSAFTHEGVRVQCTGADPSVKIVFSLKGYRLTVSGVSWETLDRMFLFEPKL